MATMSPFATLADHGNHHPPSNKQRTSKAYSDHRHRRRNRVGRVGRPTRILGRVGRPCICSTRISF